MARKKTVYQPIVKSIKVYSREEQTVYQPIVFELGVTNLATLGLINAGFK